MSILSKLLHDKLGLPEINLSQMTPGQIAAVAGVHIDVQSVTAHLDSWLAQTINVPDSVRGEILMEVQKINPAVQASDIDGIVSIAQAQILAFARSQVDSFVTHELSQN